MNYSLPPQIFKQGKGAQCYVQQATGISNLDHQFVAENYPLLSASQNSRLNEIAASLAHELRSLNADASQVATLSARFASNLQFYRRDMNIELALADNADALRSDDGQALNPCEGEKLELNNVPRITCGASPDGARVSIKIGGH